MNPSLYIMCGLPCSGKSTFAKSISGFKVLSSDDYIEQRAKELQKTYNEVFDETIQRANQAFFQDVFKKAKLKNNIIIDRTNLTKSTRLKFIKIFQQHEPIIFYFDTPIEVIKKRNNRPGKFISEEILDSMLKSLQPPTEDECPVVTFN
jgi:predicted kinase